jgi:hypothetical protein
MEGVTHEACLPWQAGEARYLPVSGDAAAWYSRHNIVDAAMESFGSYCLHGAFWLRVGSITR